MLRHQGSDVLKDVRDATAGSDAGPPPHADS